MSDANVAVKEDEFQIQLRNDKTPVAHVEKPLSFNPKIMENSDETKRSTHTVETNAK